jgi:hypothetical protein
MTKKLKGYTKSPPGLADGGFCGPTRVFGPPKETGLVPVEAASVTVNEIAVGKAAGKTVVMAPA